jgi:hypothetical protein
VKTLGRSHYEIFPDLPERWKEIYRRCLSGETSCEVEKKRLRRWRFNGQLRQWFQRHRLTAQRARKDGSRA